MGILSRTHWNLDSGSYNPFQSHRVRSGDFKLRRIIMKSNVVKWVFQSHRVRSGDFKTPVVTETVETEIEFQSHRVRSGDFKTMLDPGRRCKSRRFNLIE